MHTERNVYMFQSMDYLESLSVAYDRIPVTSKQLAYGLRIGLPVTEATTNKEFSKMLEERNTTCQAALSMRQKADIFTLLTHDEICSILKRNIVLATDITYPEFLLLMKVKKNPLGISIKRLARPIKITENWEYGWHDSKVVPDGKFYYLKSTEYMMIDVDLGYDGRDKSCLPSLDKIKETATRLGLTVRVYQTYAGYHVFITSQKIRYDSKIATDLMMEFGGDIWYSIFSRRCGFCIRLCRKLGRENDIVGKYITTYGNEKELPEIINYLAISDRLISHHTP